MKKILIILIFATLGVAQGQTFSTLLQDKQKLYYVTYFGAKGDSTTADQTACQNAINAAYAAGGGTVMFPKGVYKVTGLHGRSGVNLFGYDAKLVGDASISYDYILHLQGALVDNTTLTANGTLGAASVSVTSSADFAAGDYVVISDSTYGNTTDGLGKNQEFNRVLSVAAGTINLVNTLIGTYATASTGRAYLYNPIHDVNIEGLTFEVPASTTAGGMHLEYTYNVTVNNCNFKAPYNPGIDIDKSTLVTLSNNKFFDGQDVGTGGHGYGFAFYESSHNCIAIGNTTERVRENPVANGSKYITITKNQFRNSYDDGVNTHGSGNHHILITENIVTGGCAAGGIIVGGGKDNTDYDITISNNLISSVSNKGITITSTTSGAPMQRVMVRNNDIRAWGLSTGTAGIFAKYCNDSYITGNTIVGNGVANQDYGLYLEVDTNILISDNDIQFVSGYGILYTSCDTLSVLNNKFMNNYDDNFYYSGSNGLILLNGNVADNSNTLGAVTAGYNYFGSGWVTGLPE